MTVTVPQYGFPASYNESCLALMVRNPHCIFAYWELSGDQMDLVTGEFDLPWGEIPLRLRIYDLTGLDDREDAHSRYDISVHSLSNNYYIDEVQPNRSYCADLGVTTPDGRFVCLVRSGAVQTPRDSLADGSGAVMADLLDRLTVKKVEFEKVDLESFSSDGVYINSENPEREED